MRQLKTACKPIIIGSLGIASIDAPIIADFDRFVQWEDRNMRQFQIFLHSVAEVQEFVTLAMVQPFQVLVGKPNHCISGKNFMGMFSLDYSQPLDVQVDCDESQFLRFRQAAARFLAA